MYHVVNGSFANAIFLSQVSAILFALGISRPYLLRLFPGQLCPPTFDASLLQRILHVVGVSAKEEMIGACTFWVVAFVQCVHSFRYWPKVNRPRSTMSKNIALPASKIKDTVAASVFGTSPLPTIIGLDDLRPISLFERSFGGCVLNGQIASDTAILPSVLRGMTRPHDKFFAAIATDTSSRFFAIVRSAVYRAGTLVTAILALAITNSRGRSAKCFAARLTGGFHLSGSLYGWMRINMSIVPRVFILDNTYRAGQGLGNIPAGTTLLQVARFAAANFDFGLYDVFDGN